MAYRIQFALAIGVAFGLFTRDPIVGLTRDPIVGLGAASAGYAVTVIFAAMMRGL